MKLISWNVNGIMSRVNDGKLEEIFETEPDIFCIQEVKNKPKELSSDIIHRKGYNSFFYHGIKYNGYGSGVATYTKMEPISLKHGFCDKYDNEGRIQRLEFEKFNLFNVYFPSGAGKERLEDKFEFYDLFTKYVKKSGKPQVICGDFNRMSTELDSYDPKRHARASGFLPEEQEWFKEFLESGFIDSFRLFNREGGNYTWWSNRGTLREENKGIRFDYFLVNEKLKDNIVSASILSDLNNNDHAPITLELKF